MLTVGLTGGIASGKTFVAHCLADLGCHVIRADDLGRAVMAPDGEAYPAVVREFGAGILTPDGAIDRKLLGTHVFSSPQLLERLNAIVHPAVFAREQEFLAGCSRLPGPVIAVVEAAIMIEAGSYRRYDEIVLAVCTREQQIERAMKRDHLTRDQVLERLDRQMTLEEKRKYATHVIDTSGSKEDTLRQTAELYNSWRGMNR